MQFTETCKIRVIKQSSGCPVHPVKIEHAIHTITILTVKRILGSRHIILIGTCRRIKARMSIFSHRTDFKNGDIRRQQTVQFFRHSHYIQFFLIIKMGHHQRSMYSGIGSSGSHHLYFSSQKGRQCFHQALLYAASIGLNLPTVIVGSVISQINKVSLHAFYPIISFRVQR